MNISIGILNKIPSYPDCSGFRGNIIYREIFYSISSASLAETFAFRESACRREKQKAFLRQNQNQKSAACHIPSISTNSSSGIIASLSPFSIKFLLHFKSFCLIDRIIQFGIAVANSAPGNNYLESFGKLADFLALIWKAEKPASDVRLKMPARKFVFGNISKESLSSAPLLSPSYFIFNFSNFFITSSSVVFEHINPSFFFHRLAIIDTFAIFLQNQIYVRGFQIAFCRKLLARFF